MRLNRRDRQVKGLAEEEDPIEKSMQPPSGTSPQWGESVKTRLTRTHTHIHTSTEQRGNTVQTWQTPDLPLLESRERMTHAASKKKAMNCQEERFGNKKSWFRAAHRLILPLLTLSDNRDSNEGKQFCFQKHPQPKRKQQTCTHNSYCMEAIKCFWGHQHVSLSA